MSLPQSRRTRSRDRFIGDGRDAKVPTGPVRHRGRQRDRLSERNRAGTQQARQPSSVEAYELAWI